MNESNDSNGMNTKASEGLKEYQRKLKAGEIKKKPILNPIEKAKANPKSLKARINAKCFDCCCGERIEITLCNCVDCPLWDIRPYRKQ